jgi:hypothetical protein
MIFSGAVEVAQTQEQQRNTEYICRTEGGGIGVHSKTVVKDSRHRDETLLGRSFNASLNGTGSRRHTVRQSLILDSVYPLLPTADGHDLEPNDALNAAKRHPHNPAGLPEAWLNESLSEAHVAQCLRQVRARAQQAQRAKGGPSVERKDLRLTGEKVLDEYEWARKAAAMLSSRPGAVVSDERINYASGIRYIAEPVNIDEVRTRRELFVRCTDIQAAPAEFREFISVAGCFARLGPHPEQLEHVLMRLELRCDPSFRPAEVNQKLAKFGNIFGLGQPLPQVALPKVGEDEMLDSRDIHFEARIHRKDFFTLRQRLLDADLSTVGLPFGIDEASLKVMLDGGLRQNDSMDQWVKAIGDFVCKHPEPCQALQFLSHTLAKKMFTVAENSTTGTALRLNSEAQDLLNALGKPKRAGAEPYALLYQELAQACRLAERAKVALAQQHEDALIGARSKEDAAATFRLMGARLQTFKSDIFAKYGITQQQLCEYVIAKGIATEDDMFVCLHVKLEDFVQRTLGDLQHADTHHLNEIQLARFNKRIGQLSAAQQIIEATRREQARRLADMEAA